MTDLVATPADLAVFAGGLINGDCEEDPRGAPLTGWFSSGGARNDYEIAADRATFHSGRQSCHYRPKVAKPGIYGTMMQVFEADPFLEHRVRARVWVKTEGVTARGDFWVRAQAINSPGDGPGLGGGSRLLAPTSDWKRYEIVFTVPRETHMLNFGVGIGGPGELWADDATFEIIDG